MEKDKQQLLEAYLRLCQRVAERMAREGSWPWETEVDDSTDQGDLVESEDNQTDV